LLRLIPHSEEEWLLSGLESSTKVVEGGEEEEEEEERREKKKEEDRKESEETGEMSPSKWSTVMSEMRNELRGVVCRIEERDMQTKRELEEFGTKLDSLFKQLKSYMAERKSSTTAPQNEGKGMTNMGQTEEGRGSSTSPAPMDVDELEKVVQMVVNVRTFNREEEKEEYEVLAVEEEENPEATISIKHGQQLLESRRDFCGHDLLHEEQKQIVHSFLSQTIDWTKVMNNRWDGYVTRQHVHDILFGKVIVDDAIDIGYQFLIEKMENSPNQYHTCTYTPALLVHNFQSRKAKIMERVTLLDAFLKFCGIMDDPLELVYDDQCPDQSYDSADCALFVIKFMETISRKGEIEWTFSQADMKYMRAQFAIEILTHASAKSLTM
ncbi:hypothetical protein Taro_023889, partial [Colocasia esculenta]|nr:hypothetical protein [Colocasia esculenta]